MISTPFRRFTLLATFVLPAAFAAPILAKDEDTETASPSKRLALIGGPAGKTLEKEFVIRERIDAFFDSARADKVREAFETLLKGSPIAGKNNVEELIDRTEEITSQVGKLNSYELVRTERIGSRLLRFTYMSYRETIPLQWQFYGYRPSDEWVLLDITVNSVLESFFEGAEKPSRDDR